MESIESKPRFFIETFGCQMNVNDSEKVAGLLHSEGYEAAPDAASADFVFVNTCAVRERAAEKLYHSLGRLKRIRARRPQLIIGVGGCVAQLQGMAVLDRAPYVDVLVGTHNFGRVPELVRRAREGRGPEVTAGLLDRVDLDRKADSFAIPASAVAHTSPVRAYVTVMEGCNHVCSFCVVPRTRGPEVCRDPADVVAEVQGLVARGTPEVMLLGQTVNAYRFGTLDFAGLLERVAAIRGLVRLRFTTSHPAHVTPRLAQALSQLPNVCPHLHLPVQSGSDRVLSSMRRGYTRAQFLETIALLRRGVPDLALSSDVIAGYPGETEEDFEATASLVDEVGFEGLFVFAYSPRPGTTATRVAPGFDVPDEEKKRRVQWLNQNQQRAQARRNAAHVGRVEEVLVESAHGPGRLFARRLFARTRHFRIVHFDGPEALVGRLTHVEITQAGPNALTGRAAASNSLTPTSAIPIF